VRQLAQDAEDDSRLNIQIVREVPRDITGQNGAPKVLATSSQITNATLTPLLETETRGQDREIADSLVLRKSWRSTKLVYQSSCNER
jgi:hypothetical protein